MQTEWTTASLQAHLLGQLPVDRVKKPDEETLQCPCAECELIKKQWHDQEAHDKKIGKEIAEKLAVQKGLDTKKAEIEALKAKVAAKKAAAEEVKLAKAHAAIAENVAKAQAVKQPLIDPAGNKQKYGGTSPYNDKDVAHAQDYLIEMNFDKDVSIPFMASAIPMTRMVAHMLAEFAGHRSLEKDQTILKLNKEVNMNGNSIQLTQAKNKIQEQQSRIHQLQAQVEAMKKQGITIPLPGEFVSVSTCRKLKDI